MTDVDALAAYLLARLDEDQARADGRAEPYTDQWHTMLCGERQLYWTEECHCGVPAQVLAEVAAKRAIIDDLLAEPHHVDDEDPYHSCERVWKANPAPGYGSAVCTCGRDQRVERRIRILAQPYAARDDFPPELHAEIADRG